MKMRSNVLLIAAALWMASLTGCETTGDEPIDGGSSADTSEFDQGETPESDMTDAAMPSSLQLGTAYFDYDRSEIREDQRAVLRANSEVLIGSNEVTMIEGHADERGSEEYNLALGERRAEAVRKYLAALGVPSSQMRIVSYGESRPAVAGHDESAWGLNRRAEFSTR